MRKPKLFTSHLRGLLPGTGVPLPENGEFGRSVKRRSAVIAVLLGVSLLLLTVLPSLIHEWSIHLRDREVAALDPLERAVDSAERALTEINADQKGYLLTGQKDFLVEFPARHQELDAALEKAGQMAQDAGANAPRLVESFRGLIATWTHDYALPVQELAQQGAPLERIKRIAEHSAPVVNAIRISAEQLRTYLAGHREFIEKRIERTTRWSFMIAIFLGTLSLLASAYLFAVAQGISGLFLRAFDAYQAALGKSTELETRLSLTGALLRHAPFAIAVIDCEKRVLRFGNRAFERLPFLEAIETTGHPLSEALKPGMAAEKFLYVVDESVHDGTRIRVLPEVEYRPADGAPTYWTFRAVPFGEQEEEPDQLLLLWEDVSAEITAEKDIERERQHAARLASELQVVVDNMGDGVVVVNSRNEATIVNTQARELLGVAHELRLPQPIEAMGKEIARSLDMDAWRQSHSQAAGAESSRVSLFPTQSGRLIEAIATPIAWESGKTELSSLVGVLHDVTEYKKAEREKDEFLAIASHELRTPLTVLSASAQLVERGIRSRNLTQVEAASAHMLPQLRRLNLLILQLFDFANIQADRMQLKTEKVDLTALTPKVVEDGRTLSPDHEIEVELPGEPLLVLGDVMRIEQVLFNLISNSIRYSPKKSRIHVALDTAGRFARICVSDHGIGIPKDDLPRIFRRFSRGSNVGNIGGMGIGLYVSSEILRAHGGRIWAESPGENLGSRFCLELPLMSRDAGGSA